MTEPKIFCKRLKNVYLEVMIKLRLRKSVIETEKLIYNIILRLSRGDVEFVFYRIFDMVAQNCGVCSDSCHIVKCLLEERRRLSLVHLQAVEKLIVRLHHAPVKKVSRLIILNNAKSIVDVLHPIVYRPELQILDAARRGYYLYIFHALRFSVAL